MKVVYLLNGSALYGGVKVVYQHVCALRRAGVAAEAVSPEPPPSWFPEVWPFYRRVPSLDDATVGAADVAIGTMYFTVPAAFGVRGAVPAHLCQCYEALWQGLSAERETIDAIYHLPTLKLAVSPHLVELVTERTGQRVHWIPQPFDPELFSPPRQEPPPRTRLRVLVSGLWRLDIKGVDWGMRALRPLAEEGWLELVRLAQETSAEELALWPEAEVHTQVSPAAVPELLRSVDVYLGLSDEVEGFGLPGLEAMGCARPCVLTDNGATRALDPGRGASLRIPIGDGEALRGAVRRLRDDIALRRALGAAGRQLAVTFTETRTATALVDALEGALRSRTQQPRSVVIAGGP
jgi:glycosyltransferase involved in cell wall biosynthesis